MGKMEEPLHSCLGIERSGNIDLSSRRRVHRQQPSPNLNITQLLLGLLLAGVASYLAMRAESLSPVGAMVSTLLGTVVFGLGGWQWALLLLVFFVTSSALSRAFTTYKTRYGEDYAKGGCRDAAQVIANGAVATTFVVLHFLLGPASWIWCGFAAALAAANADTWATELGVLSGTKPRLITNPLRSVEPGTSGAVSVAGTFAALGGSVLMAASARLLQPSVGWVAISMIGLGGLMGSLVDSVLGATIQAIYFCPVDQRETEKHPLHGCGSPTYRIRGWKWLNNDWINAACTGAGAVVTLGLSVLLRAL